MNFERGIYDGSRSQYHNRAFKEAAEALDLAVEQVPHYGFAMTRLKPATVERYQEDLMYLAAVLIHRAKPIALSGATPRRSVSFLLLSGLLAPTNCSRVAWLPRSAII